MKIGPFRALLAAHAQMTWNRTKKGLGRRGMAATALAIGFLMSLAVPMFATFAFLGYLFGHGIDKPLASLLLGSVVGFVACAFGIMGGVLGGTRQLAWEAYRSYPIPFRTLFFAEMSASAGDVLALGFIGLMASMAAAFLTQRPLLLPWLSLLLVQAILWMLFLQQLVGTLATAAVRRLRVALLVITLSAWAGFALLGSAVSELHGALRADNVDTMLTIWRRIRPSLEMLPPVMSARALGAVQKGAWRQAAWLELPMLTVTVALGVATYLVLQREASPRASHALESTRSARLWRLSSPVLAMARLHAHHLTTSLQGRFGLVIPIVTVVLIKGPLANVTFGRAWMAPGAILYVALTATQLQFNQFGFDGQGAKTLLLLPIRTRDILLGKAIALAAYSAVQYAALLALLTFMVHPGATVIVGSALLGGCLVVAHVAQGHWVSVIFPRPLPFHRVQGGGLQGANLFPLGLGLLNAAVFGGAYGLVTRLAPRATVPAAAVLFALTLAGYAWLLPRAARFVERRQERLVEMLG